MVNNKISDMEQTAVEWLVKQTRKPEWHSLIRGEIIEQAKQMEQKQRAKIRLEGYEEGYDEGLYDALNK